MRAVMAGDVQDNSSAEERLRLQIEAYHAAALAYAAVKLGLPEAMGLETWEAARLADRLGLSAPHLLRVLRGLVSIGICEERAEARFALAPLGRALLPDSPSSLREKVSIVVGQYWRPWAELSHTLRSGEPAFGEVFGLPVAEWRRTHPEEGALFETYLAKEAFASAGPILAALGLKGVKTVAEIGGYGGLLAALLKANPELEGILFDVPETVAAAETFLASAGVAERVRRAGGDALTENSVAADLYLLNGVLRNFGDAGALALLRNCRKAMPESARLVVVERLLPHRADEDPAAIMLDLHMMTITDGRVRTRAEIETLLVQAGLSPARLQDIEAARTLLEAVPAGA
jgi:hypothetical protein